ncbi:hypothetical protein BJ508DRAFT_336201 [Ascobolus immersus RN42]|uniref:DUF6532 domain-containing protein n=1 Tax=Ascobolus immersus RN42 TaxID=1160509 RepID=A0A3N4HE83_ASCIM|nr:hypothetical protein BJ508DRAFT_336201 [Ascobolus immersus RN42]
MVNRIRKAERKAKIAAAAALQEAAPKRKAVQEAAPKRKAVKTTGVANTTAPPSLSRDTRSIGPAKQTSAAKGIRYKPTVPTKRSAISNDAEPTPPPTANNSSPGTESPSQSDAIIEPPAKKVPSPAALEAERALRTNPPPSSPPPRPKRVFEDPRDMRSSPPPPAAAMENDEALFSQANGRDEDPIPFNAPTENAAENTSSSSSPLSSDDEEERSDDDEENTVDDSQKEKPANAYVSPSGQVRSKDSSTILQLGASSYANKTSGNKPRASMAPPFLPQGHSTLAEEGATLPADNAPFPHQYPQQQPPTPDDTVNPTPSEVPTSRTGDDKANRGTQAYNQVLKPPQLKVFKSSTVVAGIWFSFKGIWSQALKVAAMEAPAPFTSNVWRCIVTKFDQTLRSFYYMANDGFIQVYYLDHTKQTAEYLLENNRFCTAPSAYKEAQNHHLMFLAPQIRAFILRMLYDNSKSPGNKYLHVKKCVDNINGKFICLIASSLKLALRTKAHGDKYSQEEHQSIYEEMMGYWDNIAQVNRDTVITTVIGSYLIANTIGNKATSNTAKLLSTAPSEAGPLTDTQLSQLDEMIKEIHKGNGQDL